jgi:hypothetical protein
MNIITQNPYRILGVLSNAPIKDRVANQNRLNAFAKVGKEVVFPYDFATLIPTKPTRTAESIAAANTAINLDRDQLKYALFWFIKITPIDEIALNHLQSGDKEKASELLQKKLTCSSLINLGILALLDGNAKTGFNALCRVIHSETYRSELLQALKLNNLNITEGELAELFITELLKEVPANELLKAVFVDESDRGIISKRALEEPIATINAAIETAKSVSNRDSAANLKAGTKLMNDTKRPLKLVRDVAGADSPQYQLMADSLAKQILQCSINYYNNAPDEDVESPKKAMVLQKYALDIAVGKLTKDRCQENCKTLQEAIDEMPPIEVAVEVNKVREELRKFCKLPDLICHSVTLLNATQSLLQTIKYKLGSSHPFYLKLSTQIVGNALHNVIEEVNQAQNRLTRLLDIAKERGIDPRYLSSLGEVSPRYIIENHVKPALKKAWDATKLMDSFDMEDEFKTQRYLPNRKSLKDLCNQLDVSTSGVVSSTRTSSSSSSSASSSSTDSKANGCLISLLVWIVLGVILGAIFKANDGDFGAGFCASGVLALLVYKALSS